MYKNSTSVDPRIQAPRLFGDGPTAKIAAELWLCRQFRDGSPEKDRYEAGRIATAQGQNRRHTPDTLPFLKELTTEHLHDYRTVRPAKGMLPLAYIYARTGVGAFEEKANLP